MKKVLLVYPGFISREVPLNLLYISAALKKAGYDRKELGCSKGSGIAVGYQNNVC